MALKKLLRTLQFYAPGLQDQRYVVHRAALKMFGVAWRREIEGLRLLRLGEGPLLDIGAFRGFAIDAMRALCPSSKIMAFEPNRRMAGLLQQEFASDPSIDVRAMGLGGDRQSLTLYIPEYRGFSIDALGSLNRDEAAFWLEGRVFGYDASCLHVREEVCDITPLDELGLTPAFIKVYAQGFEKPIIEGASNTLRTCRPPVIAPARRDDINRLMRTMGYQHCLFDKKQFHVNAEGPYFTWHIPEESLASVLFKKDAGR